MTQFEQEKAAKKFVELWKDKGYEKGEAQKYWIQLLREVFGIKDSEQYIDFELPVKLEKTSFADGYIEATHTLIEMKGRNVDLRKPERQSDGTMLTPFQQAKRYSDNLGYTKRARWIIVSNFHQIDIYDMDKPHSEPERIELNNLSKDYYLLNILVDSEDENIKHEENLSVDAGVIVGKIYRCLATEYLKKEPDETKFAKSINALCVRLVFCLYAEDSGLFGKHMMFHDYLKKYPASELRTALIKLFKILDTPKEQRDPYENEELLAFPYINGGLFADENIIIPQFTEEIKQTLLIDASEKFNWSDISPTIFGGVFESTLNPETRRSGGMHYTSVKNIHKVIDSLFLNELTYELDQIISILVIKDKKKALLKYQEKLSKLKFLDPACGSGNFLTETYISLRKLENRVIEEYYQGQAQFAAEENDIIKVSINQFYGIEINDFAVTVAKTALWIAEAQMYKKTRDIVLINSDFLPLKSYTQIVEDNSLRIDWNSVVNKSDLNYIIGNPPFIGYKEKDESQKEDLIKECTNLNGDTIKNVGSLDYVSGWYYKAIKYIANTNIKVAFVSTNSITQGEQVALMWKTLIEEYGLKINFAYRTFIWDSEANSKAHVHCIIIGFSVVDAKDKIIYDNNNMKLVKNINAYLMDAPNIWIESRRKPMCDVKEITLGVHIFDDHNFIFTEEEKDEFIKREPNSEVYFKEWVSANDFLHGKCRYYLDLQDCPPNELKKMPLCIERIRKVKEYRANNKSSKGTILEENIFMPKQGWKANCNYIAIPNTSSERRKYLPIKFMTSKTIITMPDLALPNGDLCDFGIISSNVHMAWIKSVCGRMKSDYRYANGIVYNNFPFPNLDMNKREKIENSVKKILEIREKYNKSSLADLYDPDVMPPDLFMAHKQNDIAVMEAYGFNYKKMSEADCVAELMKMYQELLENN